MAPIPTPAGFAQGFLSNPVRSLWNCEIENLFAAVTTNPKAPMSSTVYAYCVLTVQAFLERGAAAADDVLEELATARAYIGLYDGAARAAKRIRVKSARIGLAGWSTMAQTAAAEFHLEMAYDNFGYGFQGDPQPTLASLSQADVGTHDEREKGARLAEAGGKEGNWEDECELALLMGDEKDFDPEQLEEEVNFWRDF
ncbi:hypothetical protein HYQ46_006774 [Verticillium longisporum]|nr:hypothetical protein HYQ46_006774 [Verticillium longisporum]